MKRNWISGIAAAMTMMSCVAWAGTINIFDIPLTGSDAASGISSANTYTHALDFGSTAVAAYSINSVPITQAGTGGVFSGTDATSGAAWSISGSNQWHAGNTNTRTDGNMSKMLRDMYVPFTNPYTLTLSSLTAGTEYSTRIYYRPWVNGENRSATLTFNGDGTPLGQFIQLSTDNSAHYVAYDFTASGTSMTVGVSSSAWHLYGVTNQVIPEPGSGLMLLAGVVGLGLLRKKIRG